MKTKAMILVALIWLAQASSAENCSDFSGHFLNIRDGYVPVVNLVQTGCTSIAYSDDVKTGFTLQLDGSQQPLPLPLKTSMYSAEYAYYRADWINEGAVRLHAWARINVLGVTLPSIGVSYTAVATLNSKGKITIKTSEIALRRFVNRDGSVQEDAVGFLRGANYILDLAKPVLDASLVSRLTRNQLR